MGEHWAKLYEALIPLLLGIFALRRYLKNTISLKSWLLPVGLLLLFIGGIRFISLTAVYLINTFSPNAQAVLANQSAQFPEKTLLAEDVLYRNFYGMRVNIPAGFEVISPQDGKIDLVASIPGGGIMLALPVESGLSARDMSLEGFHAAKNPTKQRISESIETIGNRKAHVLYSEMNENGIQIQVRTLTIKIDSTHYFLMVMCDAQSSPALQAVLKKIGDSFRVDATP